MALRFTVLQAILSLVGINMLIAPANAALIPVTLNPGDIITSDSIPQFFDDNLDENLIALDFPTFGGSGTMPTGVFLTFVSKSPTNPFGGAALVFGYAVSVGSGEVVGVTMAGFAGFDAAVKITDFPGSPGPYDVKRSADGDKITFEFLGIPSGPLPSSPSDDFNPANSSQTMSIYTNAPAYKDPIIRITDATGSFAEFDTLGPSAAPEPSSVAQLLAGAAVLFLLKRRSF